MKKKKTFDAIAFMREARQRLEDEWANKPRSEEIEHFKKVPTGEKKASTGK